MTIGEKIRMLRKKFKMSQKELAQKAHISETALINYEKNRRIPPMDIIKNLCVALNNISPEYLVFGESYNFWLCMEEKTDKYFIEELNKFRYIKFKGSDAEARKEQQKFLDFLSENNLYYALPSININPKNFLKNPFYVMIIPDDIKNNIIVNIDDIVDFNKEVNFMTKYCFHRMIMKDC